MKSEVKKEKNFQKGFTLVEVILVVAIITIISAIAELNNSSTSWSIDHGGDIPNSLQDIFNEQGDLKKLGIGADSSGNFKIGNIHGKILYSNGEVYAKTDPNSKAFPNEEIRK